MELIANIMGKMGATGLRWPSFVAASPLATLSIELFDSLREGINLYLENNEEESIEGQLQIKAAVLSDLPSA